MMENIQNIIQNRQYQGALENFEVIRPYKSFPKPSSEQFKQVLDTADLSLRAILDSPIGVFEFKQYTRAQEQFPVAIDFLVQYEKVKELETPDLNSASALMELAMQLPQIYQKHVSRVREEFKKVFGPVAFVGGFGQEQFVNERIQSLDMRSGDAFPSREEIDSKGNELFPDSTSPQTMSRSTDYHSARKSGYNMFGRTYGGFMHRNKMAPKEGQEGSVYTEFLSADTLKLMSDNKRQQLRDERKARKKAREVEDGDFNDKIVAEREREANRKAEQKRKALKMFSELATTLQQKAQELLQHFKTDDNEFFKEMIEMFWYSDQKLNVPDFLMFRDLGRGAFGVVSSAKVMTTGTLTAIKCMNKKLIKGKKAKRLVSAEKAILQVLGDNPSNFTIWLQYSFQDRDYFYMAIPLCTGGALDFHLKNRLGLPLKRAMFHFAEVIEGVDHLHSLGIVYRDLKPENIIFDSEGHARISDMGLAIQTNGLKIRGKAGTPGYWAPEVITNRPYSFSADHWSLGCVLYELLSGRCCFSQTNTGMERNEATLKWEIQFPRYIGDPANEEPFPADAKDLIRGLLNRDRSLRYGATETREHKFFDGLNWFKLQMKQLVPPWTPRPGAIYAPDQMDLDYRSNDRQYRKIKILPEDEIESYDYTSKYAHQCDIVQVLETRERGELEFDNRYDSGFCYCC